MEDDEKKEVQTVERRFIPGGEIRFEDTDRGPMIRGYAAVFNRWSEDLGWFREKIDPGAFSKTIMEDDIRGLWNHDPNWVLGRNKSGTMSLREDGRGLFYEISPPDTEMARGFVESIKRGDVTGSSFAFVTREQSWVEKGERELDERTLIDVQLLDVSPVTYPAYLDTTVAMRSKNIFLAQSAETDQEPKGPAEIVFPNLAMARLRMIKSEMEKHR
jgi:HK97 family phage prohead protease